MKIFRVFLTILIVWLAKSFPTIDELCIYMTNLNFNSARLSKVVVIPNGFVNQTFILIYPKW